MTCLQVPGAMEEWGVAGGGEGGDVTEADSEAQMQQQTPAEAGPTSAFSPESEAPAPTQEVSIHLVFQMPTASGGIPMHAV